MCCTAIQMFSSSWRQGPQNGQSCVAVRVSPAVNFLVLLQQSMNFISVKDRLVQLLVHHSSGTRASNRPITTMPCYHHVWAFFYVCTSYIPDSQCPLSTACICQESLYVFLIWKYCLPQTKGSFLLRNTEIWTVYGRHQLFRCTVDANSFKVVRQNDKTREAEAIHSLCDQDVLLRVE